MPVRRIGRFAGTPGYGQPGWYANNPQRSPGGPIGPIPGMNARGIGRAAVNAPVPPLPAGSGVEESQGDPYEWSPELQAWADTPLNPAINLPNFKNPYQTVMYLVSGIPIGNSIQALPGNSARTYLLLQNQGPGNLFVGIGTNPNASGSNVLALVSSQVYEQIGGGFFLPPNPWYPNGISIPFSFVSPEYIQVSCDTADTTMMVLEGSFSPTAQAGQT